MEGYEQLFTVQEVAALLRHDEKTVRRWIAAGKIPAMLTPGGQWRIRASDVNTLLAPGTAGPADPSPPPQGAGPVPTQD